MKRIAEIGFWLGVLCACIPLLMYLFGNTRQWQLRHEWQTAENSPASASSSSNTAPASGDDGLLRLRIPRLHVDSLVVGDTTNAALAQGPGHFPGTAMPGQVGNCAIAAHRNIWGCWFANLNELEPGDRVILETLKRHFVYLVTDTETVPPDDTSVLKAKGHLREVSLITCTVPPSRRIVVHGVLDHVSVT
ncbi:MAG TPA: class E sortase [Armatimonadota bacterium]|nr:class E sortase [Armatimonadota bacterium]